MNHHYTFWPAVRDEYKRGSTQEEAFRNICKQNGLNPPSYKTICEFLDCFYDKYFHDCTGFYESLRFAVIGQYSKFTHVVSSDNFSDFSSDNLVLNNRFKLKVGCYLDSFTITDLFNKEIRDLQIAPFDRPWHEAELTMAQTDHDLLLMSASYGDIHHHFLLKIDFTAQTCSILDTTKSAPIGNQIITDTMNSSEFAYLGYPNEEDDSYNSMHKGRIVSNRIIMDDRLIEFNCNLYLCKLENGKIFGFLGVDEHNWKFCELSFDTGSGQIFKSYNTEFPGFNPRYVDKYVWSKSKFYTCYSSWYSSFLIIVFDAETYKWTKTKVVGMGRDTNLSVDENDVLTVNADEISDHGWIKNVCRFPMKKPDKLKYIAWSTIRRASIYFESDLYERLLPRLPLNSEFRPFAENYTYNIECDMKMEH